MGRALTPDERRELLGAYALGALDDDEREQVEELVLDDAAARAELHTLQLGVAWLDHASTRAPMHVWRNIADEIEPDVREPEVREPDVREPDVREAEVVPLARPRRWPARVLAVAAALVIGAVAAVTILMVADGTRGDQPSVAALATRAAERPGATTAALVAPGGATAGEVVVGSGGRAYLVWSDAPEQLATSRTYQLWELTPDGPRSAGLLGPAPGDQAFRVGASTSGVAVTREPRGGSTVPTGTPVAVATIA